MVWVLINQNDNSIHDVVDTPQERWGIPFGPPGPGGADFQWVNSQKLVKHSADWSYDGADFTEIVPPPAILDPNPETFEILQWMIDNNIINLALFNSMPQLWKDNLTSP